VILAAACFKFKSNLPKFKTPRAAAVYALGSSYPCSTITEVDAPAKKPMLIEVEHQNDVCFVRLKGRLVTGTDPVYLQAKTDEIKSRNCTRVLADVRELQSIGSTGVGFLVGIYTSVTKKSGGRFVVVGAGRRVLEVLELTRLNTVIPMVSDLVSGLAMLQGEAPATKRAAKG
jgi:anti-anti-sigma factor